MHNKTTITRNEITRRDGDAATYCPEDDKLRLYVGRVPREEYDFLRAEGWTSTPKQSEAGQGEFSAVWTPAREATALVYGGGFIDDEDVSPQERAADRAERFSGYRDKRLGEATGHADRFDAGPQVHGFQNPDKAERAAARHDRIADRAGDCWSRADYWTRRTEGVIGNALYRSEPSVRMGRIKTLEAELRQIQSNYTPNEKAGEILQENKAGERVPFVWCGHTRGGWWVEKSKVETIRAAYAKSENHIRLRLAYENQMLEAQGGRAAALEMEPGGTWQGGVIAKVNKSTATGRVTSVAVIVPRVTGYVYKVTNEPGTEYALAQFDTERAAPGSYQPPTDASRAKLAEFTEAKKAAAAKRKSTAAPCPLINPTDADAERLQAVWNEQRSEERNFDGDAPRKVRRMTQAEYSAASKGSYSPLKTCNITGGGMKYDGGGVFGRPDCPSVAQVRSWGDSVIVITDKPQKPFPANVWHDPRPAIRAEVLQSWGLLESACRHSRSDKMTDEESAVFTKARIVGWAYFLSLSQFGLTDAGRAAAPKQEVAA